MSNQNVQLDSPVVLVVSPFSADYGRLAHILESSGLLPRVQNANSVRAAIAVARRTPVPVAIVERDLPDGTWRKLLDGFQQLPVHPLLIVASVHADEYLWAEALNLGAFDVLAKPFDAVEVTRVVTWACLRWREINPSERPHRRCASELGEAGSGKLAWRQIGSAATD